MTALMPAPPQRTVRGEERRGERSEGRVLLDDIAWDTYLRLRESGSNGAVRMTFDDGRLELVSPSGLHERFTELWGLMVRAWTEELRIPIGGRGSTTYKSPALRKGFEADRCFSIQNEAVVRGKDEIDLEVDPPPDLALEVDITSPSIPKLPIFAAIKVPEVWHWRNDRIRVLLLGSDGSYSEAADSRCLPGFPFDEVLRIFEARFEADDNTLIRRFREWVRQHRSGGTP